MLPKDNRTFYLYGYSFGINNTKLRFKLFDVRHGRNPKLLFLESFLNGEKTRWRNQVLTNALIDAHSRPAVAPCGRIAYRPTAAGTMNVSA